jgi:SPP1 family predicted phage head-tail adaptor
VIGSFRHRVVFETKTQTPDEGGGFSESWTTLATVFAAIELDRGQEVVNAGHVVSANRLRLRIRYRDDVTSAERVIVKGRTHAIDWVFDPTGRRAYLLVGCTESLPS